MKNIFCLAALFALFFSVHVYANDDRNIPVEGEWGDERTRSFVPERPAVSINGNTLSIYLADALENLTVVIADCNGSIVYQDCISSNGSGYTHTIDVSGQPGSYTLVLSHSKGVLSGEFLILDL
jgi:hypothetical protein